MGYVLLAAPPQGVRVRRGCPRLRDGPAGDRRAQRDQVRQDLSRGVEGQSYRPGVLLQRRPTRQHRSSCYLYLGQSERGALVAERAMAGIDPAFVRNLALTSLRLGVCRMRADKPDIAQAAKAVAVAVRLAGRNHSARLVESLQRGVKELSHWPQVPEVRDVREQMITYGLST